MGEGGQSGVLLDCQHFAFSAAIVSGSGVLFEVGRACRWSPWGSLRCLRNVRDHIRITYCTAGE